MINTYNVRSFFYRWHIFLEERFPLAKHIILIIFLFLSNAFIALNSLKYLELKNAILSLTVVFITFIRLRIFDEIKDYKSDCLSYPTRPLARKIISVSEAKKISFILMCLELFISLIIGIPSLIACSIVCLYSFIMYKEFFIGSWLRPKLATYALTHTLISSFISLFIFSSLTKEYFFNAPKNVLLFSFSNWMIFNVFEFGRKTFSKDEEKKNIASYSKNFKPLGATLCVLFMAFISEIISINIGLTLSWPILLIILLITLFLFLLVSGIFYVKANLTPYAKTFRFACSMFILLYNLIISLGFIL